VSLGILPDNIDGPSLDPVSSDNGGLVEDERLEETVTMGE
jgi:hypothetical protein